MEMKLFFQWTDYSVTQQATWLWIGWEGGSNAAQLPLLEVRSAQWWLDGGVAAGGKRLPTVGHRRAD